MISKDIVSWLEEQERDYKWYATEARTSFMSQYYEGASNAFQKTREHLIVTGFEPKVQYCGACANWQYNVNSDHKGICSMSKRQKYCIDKCDVKL